ncbi:hypothetical protein JW823_03420 [bacterium]|nr:hypothetical protein [candidate division CSSED10-310 bacterium]
MLKTILDFILNEDRLNLFFRHLLWMTPAIGLIIGCISGWIRHRNPKHAMIGLSIGLIGSMISALWYMYNAIMDHFGLDSVAGLLINLLIFTLVGLLLGWITRYFFSCKK